MCGFGGLLGIYVFNRLMFIIFFYVLGICEDIMVVFMGFIDFMVL